jgi:hypothetical protein
LEKVQSLLLQGQVQDAVDWASGHHMWSHALLLSYHLLSPESHSTVMSKFIEAELCRGGSHHESLGHLETSTGSNLMVGKSTSNGTTLSSHSANVERGEGASDVPLTPLSVLYGLFGGKGPLAGTFCISKAYYG